MRADREIITPKDRDAWLALRVNDVTSTESAKLFGLSPYGTEFELWHEKRDAVVVQIDGDERMDWGTDLQDAIATAIARRRGVLAEPMREYIRLSGPGMGASFDWRIIGLAPDWKDEDGILRTMFKQHGVGCFEIKNVDRSVFKDKWVSKDEETGVKAVAPPEHIDVQVQHQLHVSGYAWSCIGVLLGGNKHEIVPRLYDQQIGAALETRIIAFWQSVKAGTAPQPKFPGDAEFVCKLYGQASGSTFDGRGNADLGTAIAEYEDALAREKLAKEDKKIAQAKALQIIGTASRVLGDGFTISAGQVAACSYTVNRNAYRGWKVTRAK